MKSANIGFRSITARVSACTLLAALTAAPSLAQKADLSRLVVVGDSLSAGFQSASLLDVQQVHGYGSVVAAQAGVPLPMPLIGFPGIPNVLTLVSPGPPPIIAFAPGTSIGRDDPAVVPMDLAVPGHVVQDALTTRPDFPIDSLTDLVLGLPGLFLGVSRSQVEWAENLAPTTIIVWLGAQDALNVIHTGDPATMTPVPLFKASYAEVMTRLAATGARLVVANVPDVTVVPFLTSAEKVAAQAGLPLDVIAPILGIGPGAFVAPDAFSLIPAILANPALGPLPGNLVLDAAEVAIARATVDQYNSFIALQAQMHGGALVDIHALTDRLRAHGFVAHGQRLTTDFLGGLFSLDGTHPSNTGYGLFANEFIHVLNTNFGAGIPPANLEKIVQADPLVLIGVGHPPSALGHVSPEAAKSLRAVMLH
jgi:hypothetical protein